MLLDIVMVRERDDAYLVSSRAGQGLIERDYSRFRYTAEGHDPLGYTGNPRAVSLMDGGFHDKDSWFAATAETNHPDALFQIAQLFDSPRCGDIVVSSELGWDFMDQGHRASHGGLEKAEMVVPCVMAGPGVRQGTIPLARTVDLYPTYLRFLGIPNYDGEVLNVFL